MRAFRVHFVATVIFQCSLYVWVLRFWLAFCVFLLVSIVFSDVHDVGAMSMSILCVQAVTWFAVVGICIGTVFYADRVLVGGTRFYLPHGLFSRGIWVVSVVGLLGSFSWGVCF